MDEVFGWLEHLWECAKHGIVWFWSTAVGWLLYLVGGPTASLGALLLVMVCDLVSRLLAESVHAGGFFIAIKARYIRSKSMFRGTAVKIVAYYILAVVAHQLRRVTFIPQLSDVLSSVVYSFLIVVEAISIVENLAEAGLTGLQPLKRRFERERDKLENPDGAPQSKQHAKADDIEQRIKAQPEKWVEP